MALPAGCRATVPADRGFGDLKSSTRTGGLMRQDRLLPVGAFTMALLTPSGAVGESLGMDRQLKSDTSQTRGHSPFRQGCTLCDLIPSMPGHRPAPPIARFAQAVAAAAETGALSDKSAMRG